MKLRYSSKNKRLRQKKAKMQDNNRRNQYSQMVTRIFKNSLKKHGTHLQVWHVRSNDDRCLQASDVVSHFIYEGLKLNENRQKLFQSLTPRERYREQLEKNKRWQKLREARQKWFETYEVLKPKYGFVRKPKYLLRRKLGKLRKRRQLFKRIEAEGNREA